MKYSLTKIANELGLSKATVSLVLNGKARQGRISNELEKKIKDFCKKVNYLPNIHAQRMNQTYVKNIGVLIDRKLKTDNDNPFSDSNIAEMLGGIALAAGDADYRFSVQLYNENMDEKNVLDWFRNREIDGLIYYGFKMPERWLEVFRKEKRNVVGIGIAPQDGIGSVNINNYDISKKLTEYLLKQKKRKFIFVNGVSQSYVGQQRFEGVKTALEENQIKMAGCLSAEFSETKAEEIIVSQIEDINDVDAIVCANDDMAIGVIKALRKSGKSIAVTGGDNIKLGQYFSPALTTYDNMPQELGEEAFKLLLSIINGKKTKDIVIKSKLIIRESA